MKSKELWIETKNNSWDFIYDDSFYDGNLYKRYESKREKELKEYIDGIFGSQSGGLPNSILGFISNELHNNDYNERQTFPFKRLFLEVDKKKLSKFMDTITSTTKMSVYENDNLFSMMCFIEEEQSRLLKRHLERCLWDRDIDMTKESMIWQTKFTSDYEKVSILEQLMESTLNFILDYDEKNNSNIRVLENKIKTHYDKQIADMTKEHNELVQEFNFLVEEHNELRENFSLLREANVKINVIDNSHNQKLASDNRRKQKDINKLEKEKSKVGGENESLRKEIEELSNIISLLTTPNEGKSLDTSAKILFVGGKEDLYSNLNMVFPNAKHISTESKDIGFDYINGFSKVVFLTSYMSHSLYYKIKNMLNADMPVCHCDKRNMDLICREILKRQ